MSTTRTPLRTEIPESDKWDLSPLFPTDAEWEADFAKLHSAGLPSRWSPRRLPLTHPFLHACPLAVGSHGLRVTQPPLDAGAAVVCDLVLRSHASFVLRLDALPNDL